MIVESVLQEPHVSGLFVSCDFPVRTTIQSTLDDALRHCILKIEPGPVRPRLEIVR